MNKEKIIKEVIEKANREVDNPLFWGENPSILARSLIIETIKIKDREFREAQKQSEDEIKEKDNLIREYKKEFDKDQDYILDLRQQISEVNKIIDDECYYSRTCHKCGRRWQSLHCPHDGVQGTCPDCGTRALSFFDKECNCEFDVPYDKLKSSLAKGDVHTLKQQISEVNKIIDDAKKDLCLDNGEECRINLCETQGGEDGVICKNCKRIEEFKSSLAKGDVHTQRTKVTEPLDKAEEKTSNSKLMTTSAPKDFKLRPDFIGDNPKDMEIGTICPECKKFISLDKFDKFIEKLKSELNISLPSNFDCDKTALKIVDDLVVEMKLKNDERSEE